LFGVQAYREERSSLAASGASVQDMDL
jgi:hypothetical protein